MGDAEKIVKSLAFVNQKLDEPVFVNLPWEEFPPEIQKGLDGLDADHDGQLIINTGASDTSGYGKVEVSNLDGTQQAFFRYFLAFRGDNPYNNVGKDHNTWKVRIDAAQKLEDDVVHDFIFKIVDNPKDPLQWEEVWNVLTTFADAWHLYRFADEALHRLWEITDDRRFLEFADRFLMEAVRFAGATREGRSQWLDKITKASEAVGREIDRLDQKVFEEAKKQPYLLNNRGAAFTFEEGVSNTLVFRVSAPKDCRLEDLVTYYNNHPVLLVPSRFQGEISNRKPIQLILVGKVDGPGLDNDAYYDQEQVSKVGMKDEDRKDFWVSFKLPGGVDISDLRDKLKIRSYDLHLQDGRIVPGAVHFQKTRGEEVTIAFASDIHIAERDYKNLKFFLHELSKEQSLYEEGKVLYRPVLDRKNHYYRRIKRFYSSINESAEAMVAVWNERYHKGMLDKVILAGDLVDFINIAAHMEKAGFSGTNLHRLKHILDKLEVPFDMVWGNHDPHIVEYALSRRNEYFPDDPDIYKEGISLLDRAYLGTENAVSLVLLSIKGLMTYYCNDEGFPLDCLLNEAWERTTDDDVFKIPKEGMQPHFLNFQSSLASVTVVQNRYMVMMDTGIEDFAYKKYLKQDVPAPTLHYAGRGYDAYLNRKDASGLGPTPKAAGFIVRKIEEIKAKGGRATIVGHWPVFNGGVGPLGAPSTVDTMQAPVAWFFRLLPYYYNTVVDSIVTGHLHRIGVFTYRLDFKSPEEETDFRRDLGEIYDHALKGSVEIYQDMEQLVRKYELNAKIEIPGGKDDPDTHNNAKEAIAWLQEVNKNSKAFTADHGAVFLNLPAAGPPASDAPPGFVEMILKPDGQMQFKPIFVRLEPDGRILQGDDLGSLQSLQKEHTRMKNQWLDSVGMLVVKSGSPIPDDPVEFHLPDYEKTPGVFEKEPSWDVPGLTNKVGWWSLQAGCLGGVGVLDGVGGWDVVLKSVCNVPQLSIPLSHSHIYKLWRSNALLLGLLYGHDRWMGELGFDLGLLQIQGATNFTNVFGLSAAVQMPIPALFFPALWYSHDWQKGEDQILFGIKLEPTFFSWKW